MSVKHLNAPRRTKTAFSFKVTVMDSTGQTNAWVREAAALALAELTTKDSFVEAAENGDAAFPMLCSCRFLIREGTIVMVDGSIGQS